MADTVISVAVNFVETHRFRFRSDPKQSPSPDPTTWVPVVDPVRKPPTGKIVYVFMAVGAAPFQLLKACRLLSSGEIQEVTAADALKGNFSGGVFTEAAELPLGQPETETRIPEAVGTVPFRYFFYVSRHILDGSFILDLAANPRPELTIRTLDGLKNAPATIAVTDPLTIAEQLAIDYDKLRRIYMALCTTFDEQSADEKQDTIDRLKQRVIAEILQSIFAEVGKQPSSDFEQQPDDFLKVDRDEVAAADLERDLAATECILWFDGPLMTFARQTYGADGTSADWVPDIAQLVLCDGAVLSRIADCYRGTCHIRTKISQGFYFTRELIGRPDNVPGSLAKVQDTGKKTWSVVTKTWSAIANIMAALEPRTGTRAVDVNSAFVLSRMVTTYNTVFGQGLMTITRTTSKPSFAWRDAGKVIDVTLDDQLQQIVLKLDDGRFQLLSKSQSSTKFPFLLPSFQKGIAAINLVICISAAVEALRNKQAARVLGDDLFNTAKLLGGMVSTAASFPQQLASLFKSTGRGVASISLLANVMGLATGIKDTTDAYKKGDFDSAFGTALTVAGGAALSVGLLHALLNAGVITASVRTLNAYAALASAVGGIISVLCTDSDLDLFIQHCFLGKSFGQDSSQQPWSPAPFENWSDDIIGLDHQLSAIFNLTFAFSVTESLASTVGPPHNVLVIDFGVYPAGATFEVQLRGRVQKLAGGPPTPFVANMVLDPVDARFSSGTGALERGAVQVSPPAQKIVIDGIPLGLNPLAESLDGVAWQVRMNTVINPVQPAPVSSGTGYLVGVPATVPASGTRLQISGLTIFPVLSTQIP